MFLIVCGEIGVGYCYFIPLTWVSWDIFRSVPFFHGFVGTKIQFPRTQIHKWHSSICFGWIFGTWIIPVSTFVLPKAHPEHDFVFLRRWPAWKDHRWIHTSHELLRARVLPAWKPRHHPHLRSSRRRKRRGRHQHHQPIVWQTNWSNLMMMNLIPQTC